MSVAFPQGLWLLFFALVSWLLGTIPSAAIAVKVSGKGDITTLGSGNSGATNALRVVGLKAAVAVLIFDFLKGFFPPLASQSAARALGFEIPLGYVGAASGLLAMVGHLFSPWIGFRGGKGVATGAGAFAALLPETLIPCLVVFICALAISRRASVASLAAALAIPVRVFVFGLSGGRSEGLALYAFACAGPALVVWAHRGNIKRLIAGTERALFNYGKGGDDEKLR
jgi:glycerol-3-phosphate acyltransferase PlsY